MKIEKDILRKNLIRNVIKSDLDEEIKMRIIEGIEYYFMLEGDNAGIGNSKKVKDVLSKGIDSLKKVNNVLSKLKVLWRKLC